MAKRPAVVHTRRSSRIFIQDRRRNEKVCCVASYVPSKYALPIRQNRSEISLLSRSTNAINQESFDCVSAHHKRQTNNSNKQESDSQSLRHYLVRAICLCSSMRNKKNLPPPPPRNWNPFIRSHGTPPHFQPAFPALLTSLPPFPRRNTVFSGAAEATDLFI